MTADKDVSMRRFTQIFTAAILLGCVLIMAADATAYSVAVLPVADLSQGRDGVDFAITSQLVKQLRQQGLDVIETPKVIEFMTEHGIRRCDEIDSFSGRKMALSLKCDSLLLTTLYRRSSTTDQSTLILTLLHGKNGQPVWSKIVSGDLDDSQPLFGIRQNKEISKLQARQIANLARQLTRQLPTLPEVHTRDLSQVQVADIKLSPPLTRGGNPVRCRVKVNFLDSEPSNLRLNGGQQTIELRRTNIPHIYTGTFISRVEEGDQNINLSASWSPQKTETTNSLTSYRVANSPAQLYLDFHNSYQLGNIHAFTSAITIIPRMEPQRPLELWRVTVRNEQGEIVFSETQYTALPNKMHWRGINSNRQQLNAGYYSLSLTVRDIAGNEARTTAELYMQATDTKMVNIKQHSERGQSWLEIRANEAMLIPIDNWVLILETEQGDRLLTRKGSRLPATVTISSKIAQQNPACHFQIQDKLGNRYNVAGIDLETADKQELHAQLKPQRSWKTDF